MDEVGPTHRAAVDALLELPGIFRDGEGAIVGFWGLTVVPTQHLLRVGDRDLYAWCAWDTLFLPVVLKRHEVESKSPDGTIVRLSVAPDGVHASKPHEVFLSMVRPDPERFQENVLSSFCHHIHFFDGKKAAKEWLSKNDNSTLLSLQEGFRLGKTMIEHRLT